MKNELLVLKRFWDESLMRKLTLTIGCPENAKSLKSQAPQGFSGCSDIENDEMNKKIF